MSRTSRPISRDTFVVGDRVAAYWKGGPDAFPGRIVGITLVEGVSTYDVQYDDKTIENGLIPSLVKACKKGPQDVPAPCCVCKGT